MKLRLAFNAGALGSRAPFLGLLGLALSCSELIDLGDERHFVEPLDASAGSGGGPDGAAGSASGAAGSGGSAGAAGSGGSAGMVDAGDAGMCPEVGAPVPDDGSTGLLLFHNAEAATGGDCSKETPALSVRAGTSAANCDYGQAPSSGTQSIELEAGESVACIDCLTPPESEIFIEALIRVRSQSFTSWKVLQPVSAGEPLLQHETGAQLWLNSTLNLSVRCLDGSNEVQVLALQENYVYSVTYGYSWGDNSARVWVRDTTGGFPIGPRPNPRATITCPCADPLAGWYSELTGSGGSTTLDDIRIARSLAAIDASY